MGSVEHPLTSLSIEGSVRSDGESSGETFGQNLVAKDDTEGGPGGASGGTILMFLHMLDLGDTAILSTHGGHGSPYGAGGGGGGRIHFHWSDIPTGDVYQPIANVRGGIHTGFVFILISKYFTILCDIMLIVCMKVNPVIKF